ncbi:MAG: phosphoesterase RecJ-like protein [Bacteriovoracaceae bacterium]|jgi:phosphoesterase RecJ-like protein
MEHIQLFKTLTKIAKKIVISTHLHPDADGIGSQIALAIAFRNTGKEAICVNEEPLLERYKYLDPHNTIIGYEEYEKNHANDEIDLFIVADTNSLARIGKVADLVQRSKNLLFIDHHPCAPELMAIHCIDTSMAATGELVGKLIESLKVNFTQEIALPLYTSVLIDTSSFRYPTVTGNTHRLIGKLLDTGIKPPSAYNQIYGAKEISYMQMLGTVLSKAQATDDKKIAWLKLTEETLSKFSTDPEDTHGFINHLLILDNIKVACMFRQIGRKVKVSLRSTGEVDVGIMANALGGGGHDHSAATIIDGSIDNVIRDTIKKLQLMLSRIDS